MDLPRLLALSPGDLEGARTPAADAFLARLEAALGAGWPGLLVREPRLDDGDTLRLLDRVLAVGRAAGALWVALHDRVHLALARECPAVHLGFRSLPLELVRARLGGSPTAPLALGFSSHAGDDPQRYAAADYLFHSPVRATTSHPDATPVGIDGLANFVRAAGRPVLALGGLTAEDVAPCRATGAHGVAVRSALLAASDPRTTARAFVRAIEEAA